MVSEISGEVCAITSSAEVKDNVSLFKESIVSLGIDMTLKSPLLVNA